ncbi:MAG: hypothetical protein IT291_03590 [Deltaproteobacteria bacterium]|nr:hypothetical protein [Deltaproteobacteria bacterium]
MSDLGRFRALSVRERAVVALGVLLDGRDASDFLLCDKERSAALSRAAADLAVLQPELRMSLLGSLLREALAHLERE